SLDAGEGVGEPATAELLHERRVEEELARAPLPDRPGACGLLAHDAVGAREALVVGLHHVAPLARRDWREVLLPRLGKDLARPRLVKPEKLASAKQEDAAQHERLAAIRVSLGVGQRKGAAPAPAENDPSVYAEVLAQLLDVHHEIPGRVFPEL